MFARNLILSILLLAPSIAQATFPTTGILDNFNRANSTTTLGTNYTLPATGWGDKAGIISDTAYDPTASDGFIAEWNVTNFSGTLEAYVTLSTLATGGDPDGVAFTTSISTTASSGYAVELSDSTIYVYKTVNGNNTQLTTFSPSSPANGDNIGATLSPAGVITVWYAPVGTGIWGSMGTYTDTTYSCSHIGIINSDGDGTARYDNFGGGTQIISSSSGRILKNAVLNNAVFR